MHKFKHSEPDPKLILYVNLREVRPRLSELIARANHHGSKVQIRSHGKKVAALVSMEDYERIWEYEMLERFGPRDPVTGRPKGMRWVEEHNWTPGTYWGPEMREFAEVEVEVEVEPKPKSVWSWIRKFTPKGSA